VGEIPESIVLRRHRDLEGRRWAIWFRRGSILLLCAVPVLAALNVFGQRPSTASASSPQASIRVHAPNALRGGLLFQASFTVDAHQSLERAALVLDAGWRENITINTIEPSPIGEASDGGRLVLTLGHVPAGKSYVLSMEFQVNPTTVGRLHQGVTLTDGPTRLARVERTVTVFP
jgi:hypothetical protein